MDFYNKYIKYKQKYLNLKNQQGGKVPYVVQNEERDYFPFDNKDFNFYKDNQTLIFNNGNGNYLLNEKFELEKFELEKVQNNITINHINIYKLADEQIVISPNIKLPFHLCLLSKYKIFDKLYQKYFIVETIPELEFKAIDKTAIKKLKDILKIDKLETVNTLFQLDTNFKKNFLKDNANKIFKFFFNINNNNEIHDITYKYNILLKYSYCNKFLELLKLIYDLQTKIDIEFDIYSTVENFDINNLKIKLNDNTYNLEDYIIINIINFFISTKSELKDNFKQIYDYYIKDKSKDKSKDESPNKLKDDYDNAIQTYINISDTAYLFEYISDRNTLNTKDQLKNNIVLKLKLNSDLKPLHFHINNDIKNIKQLLLFNLYVDNINIDVSAKFSYIFYTTYIFYRINKPLISYGSFTNFYPINKNNFICNLLGIDNSRLISLINNSDNKLSINKKIFYSKYIKHPIHSLDGFYINEYSYTNCTENAILEFIKILFWNQTKFEIRLPPKNTETKTESLELLHKIFDEINSNLTDIELFYKSTEYHKKIHNLFSHHESIKYVKLNYEIKSTKENFYNMLCIILNFDKEDDLYTYLNSIKTYNSDISKIIISYNNTIDIYIKEDKLYTITISSGHSSLSSYDKYLDIYELIEYDYMNLLIDYTNYFSNYSTNDYHTLIEYLKIKLKQHPISPDNLNKYKNIIIKIIIYVFSSNLNIPLLAKLIENKDNNIPKQIYDEIIKACMKTYKFLELKIYNDPIFFKNLKEDEIKELLTNIMDKDDNLYRLIGLKILKIKPVLITYFFEKDNFLEIVYESYEYDSYHLSNFTLVDYLINKHDDKIKELLPLIMDKDKDEMYKKLELYILEKKPEFIKNLKDDKIKELLENLINNEYNYNFYLVIVLNILKIKPEFIEDYFEKDDFLGIVYDSYEYDSYVLSNFTLVDYLINNHDDKIKELLKKIMDITDKDNYERYIELGLYILEIKPEFIIDYFNNSNFLQIVLDSYLTSKILVDYLINKHEDKIKELLTKFMDKDNYTKYKDIRVYILNKKREFIIDYFEKDNILEIVVNMSDDFLNYLIDKHEDKIKKLLNKIMDKDNYTKYKYIGLHILNRKPEFILDYKNQDILQLIFVDSFDDEFQNLHNFLNTKKNK